MIGKLGSRRVFLTGAAALVGLPWLEATMLPTGAKAAGTQPIRFATWHVSNGFWHPNWWPSQLGKDFPLSPTLASLVNVKNKLFLPKGMQNTDASSIGGSHGYGVAGELTCVHGAKDHVSVGISVDQVYANQVGASTRIKSLQLCLSDVIADDGCPAIYNGTVSWADATTPMQGVTTNQAQAVFDKIFAGVSTTPAPPSAGPDPVLVKRNALKKSVLDQVMGETTSLQTRVSVTDRARLEQYLTGIRTLESQIQTNYAVGAGCVNPGSLPQHTDDIPGAAKVMSDLMVYAFVCDSTRVASFMTENCGDTAIGEFPWLGIGDGHHDIAHMDVKDPAGEKSKIDKWQVEELTYFLEKLNGIDEGGKTMLDNMLVLYTSSMADGSKHDQINKPAIVAGSAGGAFKSPGHAEYPNEPVANMMISILNALGVPATTFGAVGNKPVAGLV